MQVLLLLLAVSVQDYELIRRTDRAAYEEAIDLCRKAESRIATDPGQAIEKLTELIEKRPLRKMECLVRIEVFANAPEPAVALIPYQLRGTARMILAKSPGADRRRLVEQALEDFETSAAKGFAPSAEFARGARKELLSLLKPLLEGVRWEPAKPAALNGLLLRMEADQQRAEAAAFAAWLEKEGAVASSRLEELERASIPAADRQARARRELGWCDAATASLAGVTAGAQARTDLAAARARAARIAAYRGSIRLKICASPYAEVTILKCDGKDVPMPERSTPLFLPTPVEIGELEVELVHPDTGRRTRRFPAEGLRDGATYVLSADMVNGDLRLTPLP